jgi:hypothetical protein
MALSSESLISRIQAILSSSGIMVARARAAEVARAILAFQQQPAQPDQIATANEDWKPAHPGAGMNPASAGRTGTRPRGTSEQWAESAAERGVSYVPGSDDVVRLVLRQIGSDSPWGRADWASNVAASSWEQIGIAGSPNDTTMFGLVFNDRLVPKWDEATGEESEVWMYGDDHLRDTRELDKPWNDAVIEAIVAEVGGDLHAALNIAARRYGWNPTYLEKLAATGPPEVKTTWETAAPAPPATPATGGVPAPEGMQTTPVGAPSIGGVPGPPRAPAAGGEHEGMVQVIGPDGKPFWAHLAADYEQQILAETEQTIPTPEEQDQMVEQWLRDQGIDPASATAEERALAESTVEEELSQRILAFEADEGKAPYLGSMGTDYFTALDLPLYGREGEMATVALTPQYQVNDMSMWYSMPLELVAEYEERMERAGLLEAGSYSGGNPFETAEAFRNLLTASNWQGYSWETTLSYLETLPRDSATDELPEFRPSTYQAPDYDYLAENVFEIFARDLGRDPEPWEVRQLAGRFDTLYRQQYEAGLQEERQAFAAENGLGPESGLVSTGLTRGEQAWADRYAGQAGQQLGYIPRGAYPSDSRAVDPYSSFMQFFRQRYKPEMDLRKQVSANETAADRLFGSLSRMDTMIGGGS